MNNFQLLVARKKHEEHSSKVSPVKETAYIGKLKTLIQIKVRQSSC